MNAPTDYITLMPKRRPPLTEVVAKSESDGPPPAAAPFDFAPLDARRIDLANPPEKPVPVFKLCGHPICTTGNLTVIAAPPKAGKSAVIGAMLAAVAIADSEAVDADCLGFEAHPHNGKTVILFDTEQSPYDSYRLVKVGTRRAGMDELPRNFRLYRLLDVSTAERRRFLAAEMARASVECGGIHSVLVDGVGDLCVDVNSMPEAFPLVDELVQLAVLHDCPVILVLHENPNQPQGGSKTRGHLGSQLERKAESNLRVVKEGEVSLIFSERCRNASIPKQHGAQFEWSHGAGMHVTVTGTVADAKLAKKRDEQVPACGAVFEGVVGAIKWSELRERIEKVVGAKAGTSERRVREWEKMGLIKRATNGKDYLRA